jgi:hypothetical protein
LEDKAEAQNLIKIKKNQNNKIPTYGKVLGILYIEEDMEEYLLESYYGIQIIADEIIIYDPYKRLKDPQLIEDWYQTRIYHTKIPISSYNPEWVAHLSTGQIPSSPFKYMTYSLCLNPFVNEWKAKLRYLWDSEKHYRVDGVYNHQIIKFMYRYNPEMKYKYDHTHYPVNQEGPSANCMLDIYSYRFINEERRKLEIKKYLKTADNSEAVLFKDLNAREILIEKVNNTW